MDKMEKKMKKVRFNLKPAIVGTVSQPQPQNWIKTPNTDLQRQPLKTIQSHPQSSSISERFSFKKAEKVETKTICPFNIDTRHVTLRQNTEDLDWDYKYFKYTVEENSIIGISDDDSDISNDLHFIKKQKLTSPAVKSPTLEPNNIETGELQGSSPVVKQDGDGKHKRRLFDKSLQDKLQSPDCLAESYMICSNCDYTEDSYKYLLSTENLTPIPIISSTTRSCLIDWLMKLNLQVCNGDPVVIQTAVFYLDSVLAVYKVQLDELQLAAAACYWISQKMHGYAFTVMKLVMSSSHAFTAENLLAAEIAVLHKLQFPARLVLPQTFIKYLSRCCDNTNTEIEKAATFICISSLMGTNALCNEFPSTIGAAAVINAILLLKKKEAWAKLRRHPMFKEQEKKTPNISIICSIQRKTIRLMSSPVSHLEYYDAQSDYIARKIISSAHKLVESSIEENDQQ